MSEIKATPQNAALAQIAQLLRAGRDIGDKVQLPLLGGVGSMLLGKSPEEVTEWSYGNAPMRVPQLSNVPQFKPGRAETVADTLFAAQGLAPLAAIAGRAGMAAGRAGERFAERAVPKIMQRGGVGAQILQDLAQGTGVSVIKQKGGNWLAGSVEDALAGLRRRARTEGINGHTAEHAATDAALNNWVDKQLTRYVKNEMATPEDPVRALAERGVTHRPGVTEAAGPGWEPSDLAEMRRRMGFPAEGLAQSNVAKDWEMASDYALQPERAGNMLSDYKGMGPLHKSRSGEALLNENPWLQKVPPETPVYGVDRTAVGPELDFNHLIDELRNATNPNSGLPRELLLKYESLDKLSVPQAVERVSKINAWRAAQKAEADLARANNAATVLHKEYPDAGFKWVELKAPKKTGKMAEVARDVRFNDPEVEDMVRRFTEERHRVNFDELSAADKDEVWQQFYEQNNEIGGLGSKVTLEDESVKALQDALKYEGDTMGHCVGGYCPDVLEGRSRIFSLRDAKGQPHVTVEVKPDVSNPYNRWLDSLDPDNEEQMLLANKVIGKGLGNFESSAKEFGLMVPEETSKIVQIKGKANRKPNDEYLPYVQDFVKSGRWSDVGDLSNAGLMSRSKLFAKEALERPEVNSLPEYFTAEELDAAQRAHAAGLGGAAKYAAGGLVSGEYDPARVDAITANLRKELMV